MSQRTFDEVAHELAPDRPLEHVLLWPPDAFALASSVLVESEAYTQCVSPPGKESWNPDEKWQLAAEEQAVAWLKAIEKLDVFSSKLGPGLKWNVSAAKARAALPQKLRQLLSKLDATTRKRPLSDLRSHWPAVEALLQLHAIADEAGRTLGRTGGPRLDPAQRLPWPKLAYLADRRLHGAATLSFFDPSRCRVLPKSHTPQVGLAPRSISRHLALVRTPIELAWHSLLNPSNPDAAGLDRIRCLLLPWPTRMSTRDFRAVEGPRIGHDPRCFGFFEFAPTPEPIADFRRRLAHAIEDAIAETGGLDMVVLPELALSEAEQVELARVCAEHAVSLFVCGVRAPVRTSDGMCGNWVVTGLRNRNSQFDVHKQAKHHRWCLDSNQVTQYQLGAVMHPVRSWWEASRIESRSLNFTAVGEDFVFCSLVCEDLARQEPASSIVRAVGPTLVIALLMDGPQLAGRWPGRYAGVLADDPGSSVLTLTSLAMASRSRAPGRPESRAIALWRDSSGVTREISLDGRNVGVVLSLCAQPRVEYSADGRRSERAGTGRPFSLVLGGVVEIPERPPLTKSGLTKSGAASARSGRR